MGILLDSSVGIVATLLAGLQRYKLLVRCSATHADTA